MIVTSAEIKTLTEIVRAGNPAHLNFHLIQNFHLPLLAGFNEVSIDQGLLDDLHSRIAPEDIEKNIKVDVLHREAGDDLSCGSFMLMFGDGALTYRKANSGM
jgi:hypothetical protein